MTCLLKLVVNLIGQKVSKCQLQTGDTVKVIVHPDYHENYETLIFNDL